MTSQDVLGLKVVVIAGGWSDEKEISLDSGRACQKALTEVGFKGVDLLDAADGEFVSKLVAGGYDVAFVAMHGRYGEDGCIQGLLEILHMPYTFSGVLGSAVSTEKEVAKTLYRQAGIPTRRGRAWAAALCEACGKRLELRRHACDQCFSASRGRRAGIGRRRPRSHRGVRHRHRDHRSRDWQ